jgi:hypothetical protein
MSGFGPGMGRVGHRGWRGAGEGQADDLRRVHGEAQPQMCSGKDGGGLTEKLAEGMRSSGPMRRAQRRQGDLQLILCDVDVAADGEQFMQERSAFLLGPRVMGVQEVQQIALGLIGEHLDDVGQMLSLGGEFDHSLLAQVSDFHARVACDVYP